MEQENKTVITDEVMDKDVKSVYELYRKMKPDAPEEPSEEILLALSTAYGLGVEKANGVTDEEAQKNMEERMTMCLDAMLTGRMIATIKNDGGIDVIPSLRYKTATHLLGCMFGQYLTVRDHIGGVDRNVIDGMVETALSATDILLERMTPPQTATTEE